MSYIKFNKNLIMLILFLFAENKIITRNQELPWVMFCNMAARNDLFPFAGRNIKQLQAIGSNNNIKILIHFDMHRPGQKSVSKRFLIEKDKIVQLGPDLQMDSGNINTLIDFFKFGTEIFPPEKYNIMLDLWNHGTGIIEPNIKKSINPSKLFNYNAKTKLIELDRSRGFLDFINESEEPVKRGICFDDTSGNYLSNKNLKDALNFICQNYLHKKIAVLACDACLMSMIECMSPLKDCVEYFVGSEEIELGTGYNYTNVLNPFTSRTLSKLEFAKHIVTAYEQMYGKITHDYTQSATSLSEIGLLESNIDKIAKLLILGFSSSNKSQIKDYIKTSRNKNSCTYFDEPSYIDLGDLLENLLKNITKLPSLNTGFIAEFKTNMTTLVSEGLSIIKNIVVANTVGNNLRKAKGISIYFPENYIHRSYYESEFGKNTYWLKFLIEYLQR